MSAAQKGNPDWDKEFLEQLEAAHTKFATSWHNCDYATAKRAHQICLYMLPKLFEISHTRGKQGHGKR